MRINICLDIEVTPKEILDFSSKHNDLDVDKVINRIVETIENISSSKDF
ncbi:MAG: hypothetical protein IAC55_02295 [Tyzzerella sp.]|uniref:Uncharacterized protein n=1 Tax=Candidatus Fimicola merdigallinarum TaxID=2840819 RepID=A0A9D9DXU4_9FIRM|nr:hypothetical protein [Candidatus Fimicola merdigallinarum]